jgi:polyisoprenoid-binding protein YceI
MACLPVSPPPDSLLKEKAMKPLNWLLIIVTTCVLAFGVSCSSERPVGASLLPTASTRFSAIEADVKAHTLTATADRYQLDAARSKFVAHAGRAGLLWFKGHGHDIAVRDFTGEATLDPGAPGNSSLQIRAKAASMEETSGAFTAQQKQIINKELREIVLLPDQYPDIIFTSTNVTGKAIGATEYELKIAGNLTLLGVTRPITIPTKVTVTGSDLRAQGEFSIDRGDFKVKATSAFHGLVRVSKKVKFEFDIVGHRF